MADEKTQLAALAEAGKKDPKFIEFLLVVKNAWGESWEAVFAFFMGMIAAGKASDEADLETRRLKIKDPDDLQNRFAWELGVKLGPQLTEASGVILRALVKTGVDIILAAILKK